MKLVLYDNSGNVVMEKEGNFTKSDVIIRDDYIATKLWNREDVAGVLEEENIPATTGNIDEVINTGLLDSLGDCTDQDWEIIRNAVHASNQDGNLNIQPQTVRDLVCDGEHVREYYFPEDPYNRYSVIMPGETDADDDKADLAAALEDTMHRLIEDDKVGSDTLAIEMGLLDEDENSMDAYPNAISVDLGYFLPYGIDWVPAV